MRRLCFAAAALSTALSARADDLENGPESRDNGLWVTSADDRFALRVGGRIQPRLEADFPMVSGQLDVGLAFSLPTAELVVRAALWRDLADVYFSADFGGGQPVSLGQAYLDWHVGQHDTMRVGQFKRPFWREQLTSVTQLALGRRSILDAAFGAGADLGFLFHDDYLRSPRFEWAFGLVNGSGVDSVFRGSVQIDPTTNFGYVTDVSQDNAPETGFFDPALVLRLGWNHGPVRGYSQSDLERGATRYGVGLSLLQRFDTNRTGDGALQGAADWTLKSGGFDHTGGLVVMFGQRDPNNPVDLRLDAWGALAQLGYTFHSKHGPAFRAAYLSTTDAERLEVLPTGEAVLGDTTELLLGWNWFIHGHDLKWQNEVGTLLLEDRGDGESGVEPLARSQFTLEF